MRPKRIISSGEKKNMRNLRNTSEPRHKRRKEKDVTGYWRENSDD